jgi:hypothetical protein
MLPSYSPDLKGHIAKSKNGRISALHESSDLARNIELVPPVAAAILLIEVRASLLLRGQFCRDATPSKLR